MNDIRQHYFSKYSQTAKHESDFMWVIILQTKLSKLIKLIKKYYF